MTPIVVIPPVVSPEVIVVSVVAVAAVVVPSVVPSVIVPLIDSEAVPLLSVVASVDEFELWLVAVVSVVPVSDPELPD